MPGAFAATYYVDAKLGRDGASGLRAEIDGAEGPLRSLAAVSRLTLFPGDEVLLKCGQTFQGPLRIKTQNRGGEGSLRLAAYGPCDSAGAPVVSGVAPLGPGEDIGKGLRRWPVSARVAQIRVGDQTLPQARHPARGYHIWSRDGASDDPASSLAQMAGGRDVAGAQAWVRTQEWYLEERRVRRARRGLELDRNFEYPIRKGVGIYLTGKAWMIGAEPGWAYDEEAGTLTARLPADASGPASVALEEPLVHIDGPGSVSIQQWKLVDAGADALRVHLDGFLQVRGVRIERSGSHGMSITGVPYAVVEDSHIEDTGQDAIFFAESARVFVRRNTVLRAGLWGGPKPALAAINAHRTERAVVEENLVDASAYIGIRFSGASEIRRNVVLRSCQVLSDCAAIYTWRRNPDHVPPACEVTGNTVIGVAGDTSVQYSDNHWYAGIYLDDFTRDVKVAGNLVLDAEQGIYVHNAIRNAVIGNVVLGSRERQIVLGIDAHHFPKGEKLDNEVRDNHLGPGLPGYRLPTALQGREGVHVLRSGPRALAFGWADWAATDWDRVAPGCKPVSSPGSTATAVMLDCKGRAKP